MADDDSLLTQAKKLIGEDIVVAFLCLVFLFVGVFGAVNWNSYCTPTPPLRATGWSEEARQRAQERYEIDMARYNEKLQRVGQDACIPWALAVPMTIVGFVGALGFAGVLLDRHMD